MKSFIILLLISYVTSLTVKSLVTAPYRPQRTEEALAIKDAIKEGLALYEYRLSYLADNLNTLPNSTAVEAALDHHMEIFCPEPYFDSFVGITGDGHIFTNLTQIRELYKGFGLTAGIQRFNVKTYNYIITIPTDSQVYHNDIYPTIRSYFEVVAVLPGANTGLYVVLGYYEHIFRIDNMGNVCISKFNEAVYDIFTVNKTTYVSLPWSVNI
jgi:hypothetical protein